MANQSLVEQGKVVSVNLRDPGIAAVPEEQPPTSSSPNGENGVSGRKESNLDWKKVLGEDKSRLIFFPEKAPASEVKVSEEAILIAKYALTRAVDGYRKLIKNNSSNSLVNTNGSLRKVVEAIFGDNIPSEDISDDKILEQIESFFQKYPEQATFLGVYWVQEEWKMMKDVYQITEIPKDGKKLKKPDLDKIRHTTAQPRLVYTKNPDGSMEIQILPPDNLDYESYSKWYDENHKKLLSRLKGFIFDRKLTREQYEELLKGKPESGDLSISLLSGSNVNEQSYLNAVYGEIIKGDQPVLEGYEKFSFLASHVERLRKELLPVVGNQKKRFLEGGILDKDFSLIEIQNINDKINGLITQIRRETTKSLNLERNRETGKGISDVIESRLEEERQKKRDLKRIEEIKALLNEVRIGQDALEILEGQIKIPEELRELITTIRPDLKNNDGKIDDIKLREIALALLTGSKKDIFTQTQLDEIAKYEKASSEIEGIKEEMNKAYNEWAHRSSIEITQTKTGVNTRKYDAEVIKAAKDRYENLRDRYEELKKILDSEESKNLVSMRDRLGRLIQSLRESEKGAAYTTQYNELREKRTRLLVEAARAGITVVTEKNGSVNVDEILEKLKGTTFEERTQQLEAMQIVFINWSERLTQIANRIENPPRRYDGEVWKDYNEDVLRVIYVIFGEEYLMPRASGTPEEIKARLAEIEKIKKLIIKEQNIVKIGGVEITQGFANDFNNIMTVINNWVKELGIKSFGESSQGENKDNKTNNSDENTS